jgi:hypothetical protein
VAVINQTFARRYFPTEDPIGHYFIPQSEHAGEPNIGREIVGIVGDTRTSDLSEPYQPEFFLPYAQDPTHQRPIVVMKIVGDGSHYENVVRRVIASMDKEAPVFGYRTFTSEMEMQVVQSRFEAALVSGFAGMALLLSAVGLYAVLSYIAAQRTRELALRMALGASRFDVLQLVLLKGLAFACIGIGIGASTSIFATRLIAGTLIKVAPLDRSVFWKVTLVLLFVSTMAAVVPALRAARVDSMGTLREQ